ncbi:CBM9 family sugar-binding protein [Sabulilitoribacter arenilitoris]|uniref:CBM9 family sugar-binding protein n=1 Tax=Wocania arenilitoris TaxID=2044858 RepID=A0AAE3JLM3_9FLAO|nr:CBM9 family sugar-binding protein [Wocania arenilitoris]MCF7568449.1 CBM9 family sugar-binding protein [Wocania arenilitoris]
MIIKIRCLSVGTSLLFFILLSCNKPLNYNSYTVEKIGYKVKSINDFIPDSVWNSVQCLNDFSNPWNKDYPFDMSFKAIHTGKYLYLRYDVKDSNVLIYDKMKSELDVAQSDRVEIFFRKNKNMNPYFCLEIDPKGKVLDYKAEFYRRFDNSWNWPNGHLFAKGVTIKNGYRVDVILSLESLKMLGLLKDNKMEVGIYRGDCTRLAEDLKSEAKIEWITWVDPKTDEPDFHVPTSFGKIILNK